jgi:hypothetical protein
VVGERLTADFLNKSNLTRGFHLKTRIALLLAVTMMLGVGAYAGTRFTQDEPIMANGVNNCHQICASRCNSSQNQCYRNCRQQCR